ncbi:hypothetical protein Ctob_016152, partial [Chrysochromulina tobinii]
RKRQREYQLAHRKKTKEEKAAAQNELTVLRNERALMFQSLISALPVAERPAGMESFSLVQMTQLVAGKLILSRGAGPSVTGSAPGPPPAHDPVLGNWPIIVRVDLTALLKTIKEDLPLALLLQVAYDELKQVKLDKDTKGDIDITSDTTNEVIVQRFCAELKKLLGIPADDDSRCKLAAGVLKINSQGAIGVYVQSRLTKAHGHFMGVLNLLIGGTKLWKLWKPGPHPREHERVEDACINQREGELLWLPPGWYHEVFTTGISYMTSSPYRYVNTQSGVAHSMTCWHVP